MALNINKIDERIKKLQELRRIAADPEMAVLLSEFLIADDGIPHRVVVSSTPPLPEVSIPEPSSDEVGEIVKGVLEANDSGRVGGSMASRSVKKGQAFGQE